MQNMTFQTFQESMFYLLTLNCMSFMLCPPPFSLSSFISSLLQKTSAAAKFDKKTMICSHPQLFIAPYMYLFSKSDGDWVSSCTEIDRVYKFTPNSYLDQDSCNSGESKNHETNRSKNEDGFRNFLNEKERRLMERAKEDIKDLLKRNGKENLGHKILKDDDNPDSSRNSKEEEVPQRDILHKSKYWSIKNRNLDDKLVIQKARDDIVRKKYESQQMCHNQIRLLGKKFLEKSLEQGMEIQQQLAIADRILRSTQNRELLGPTSAHSIQI